jgi:hypothetical protein
MAPFNTHFLIAEQIWPELPGPWHNHFNQFCFGCIAPDVDKLSPALTQKDTHFFDRTTDYDLMATHRTAAFLQRQTEFLRQPFTQMPPAAQAFVLGYLCHLCVDEVSKHLWRRDTWHRFKDIHPGSAFAALDERARQSIRDYPAIVRAIASVTVVDVIPSLPMTALQQMQRGALNFMQAADAEAEFLTLVDMFDRPTPDDRRRRQIRFQAEIDSARRQTHFFRLDAVVQASLRHSHARLSDLIQGRIPSPGYPALP